MLPEQGNPCLLYTSGMDLIFPHHECEIAQSVASQGDDMVHYWMHNNMIPINAVSYTHLDVYKRQVQKYQ